MTYSFIAGFILSGLLSSATSSALAELSGNEIKIVQKALDLERDESKSGCGYTETTHRVWLKKEGEGEDSETVTARLLVSKSQWKILSVTINGQPAKLEEVENYHPYLKHPAGDLHAQYKDVQINDLELVAVNNDIWTLEGPVLVPALLTLEETTKEVLKDFKQILKIHAPTTSLMVSEVALTKPVSLTYDANITMIRYRTIYEYDENVGGIVIKEHLDESKGMTAGTERNMSTRRVFSDFDCSESSTKSLDIPLLPIR